MLVKPLGESLNLHDIIAAGSVRGERQLHV